jgi:hypothetical protein
MTMRNCVCLLSIAAGSMAALVSGAQTPATITPQISTVVRPSVPYRVWPSSPPEDCPFPPSDTIKAIGFTGRYANYTGADTWYPSWSEDERMFSTFTDGTVNGLFSASIDLFQDKQTAASTGTAIITGDHPLELTISGERIYRSPATPGGLFALVTHTKGRYPSANLYHEGVWYVGTYCLSLEPEGYNWGVMGPFVGLRWSLDDGVSWTDTPHLPETPLFEQETFGNVKLGALHFVDFGRNMEHSPDGKAYLVGHGAMNPDPQPRPANCSWISGDQIYLTRVTPTPRNINDASKYEFFAGHDEDGRPIWSTSYDDLEPLIDWNNHCGCVTATFNPGLGKYLLCVTDGWPTMAAPFDSYILEADTITGPWKLVAYLENFGEQAYFLNFPSRFLSEDGRTPWLCYSANFTPVQKDGAWIRFKPRGSSYSMCLQETRLLANGDPIPQHPVNDIHFNLAPLAQIQASSTYPGYSVDGAVDGIVDPPEAGFTMREWAAHAEGQGAFLRFQWREPVRLGRLVLFDRPTDTDQVTAVRVLFDDGRFMDLGPLPDDAAEGLDVRFEERTVKGLTLLITGVKDGTGNAGFAEVALLP